MFMLFLIIEQSITELANEVSKWELGHATIDHSVNGLSHGFGTVLGSRTVSLAERFSKKSTILISQTAGIEPVVSRREICDTIHCAAEQKEHTFTLILRKPNSKTSTLYTINPGPNYYKLNGGRRFR